MLGLSLRLERVSVRYPGARSRAHPALDEVDLLIGSGEHVVVVGPSGAGKTTLLHVAAAALQADRGRVLVDGEEPWSLDPRRRRRLRGRLFLAPQVPPLPPRQRVSLARALLAPARLWLLDEPLSALDPVRAARALQVLRQQAAQRGVTLVVSMHQVEMALANFPRMIGLRDGAVQFDGQASDVSPEQLQRLYAHAEPAPQPPELPSEEPCEPAPVPMVWR